MTDRHSRWRHLIVVFALACSTSTLSVGILHGQDVALAESSSSPDDSAQPAVTTTGDRDVSLRQLPANFLSDQKDIWLFPVKLVQGRHWLPTIAVVGVTAGLLAADAHDVSYFRTTSNFHQFNRVMSGRATTLEIGLVPAAFYVIGRASNHPYAEKTALLAGEAFADSMVVYGALNIATQRLRPSDIPPPGPYSDMFFHSNSVVGNSFPSGHTIEAFAVATIIARRYKRHRWVPWVAYGLAGTIAFSRVSLQAHFPSDVFVGAALGYSISRFAVLHGR